MGTKVVIVLCAMLSGCVAVPTYPDSPKLRQCQYEAVKATRSQRFYGATGVIGEAYAEALVSRDILEACMRQ